MATERVLHLRAPFDETTARSLRCGDEIWIDGTIWGVRDASLIRFFDEGRRVDADLTGADLTRANLRKVALVRANLTNADLTRADLTGANLAGAILRSIRGRGTIIGLNKAKNVDQAVTGDSTPRP